MAILNAVIDKTTKQLIRFGGVDFENETVFDSGTEEMVDVLGIGAPPLTGRTVELSDDVFYNSAGPNWQGTQPT